MDRGQHGPVPEILPIVQIMKYDVIVIGAGITGLTSAYHIKKNNSGLKIAVLERSGAYAQGNTGKATAGFRDLFSSDINYNLASSSISFYRHVQESMNYDMGMHFVGYLFLLSREQAEREVFTDIQKRSRSRFLDGDELSAISGLEIKPKSDSAQIMNLEEIASGFLGLDCGIFEPDLVSDFYFSELKRMGVDFFFNTEVSALKLGPVNPLNYPGEPFLWQEKRISGLVTSKGDFRADNYVLANDVWVSALLDPIGIDSHMRPQKRQIFQVSGSDLDKMLHGWGLNDEGVFPFTILPKAGIHFRPCPAEKSFRISGDEVIGRDFSMQEDPLPEEDFYSHSLKPVVQEYFPAFMNSTVDSMWAGYYSYNSIDAHPFLFREMNMIVITGTSGSGLMKGDAIGRVAASLLLGEEYTLLHGGKRIETKCLGVKERSVPREEFVL